MDRTQQKVDTVKGSQFLEPLFEFSGACAGCGETPYVKLASQLFGDRMIVANATGCSSIYGGNLPTTPWTFNKEGRGPAWSNSLFEDNAEFGFGFRLTIDKQTEQAREMLTKLDGSLGEKLIKDILSADQSDEAGIYEQRQRVRVLKDKLSGMKSQDAKFLISLADFLVKKSVWIMGGDGWAYDIGYGGLDHVLASSRDVNVLVLDTEVYSNTGGQMSKATPLGGVAKFAAAGKPIPKKDLALQAISYGYVYVARVAMGASDVQTVKAFIEAEKYKGPSLIIAYSHCIAHGINMKYGLTQQKLAVDSGYWPLIRFNPDLAAKGENPFRLDSKAPSIPLQDYIYNETRYKMLTKTMPQRAKMLLEMAQKEVTERWQLYERMQNLYQNTDIEAKASS
jgi:pyruvate-ferredoxin/flavodoxin oxidoreductase